METTKKRKLRLYHLKESAIKSSQKYISSTTTSPMDTLPDDVIVSILSNLVINEAVCTSVLSHRWRQLWRSASSDLVFDLSKCEKGSANNPYLMKAMRECMDLRMHQPSNMDKFIIHFNFNHNTIRVNPNHARQCRDEPGYIVSDALICDWIRFAIQKKVRALELVGIPFEPVRIKGVHAAFRYPDFDKLITMPREIIALVGNNSCCFGSLTSLTLENFNMEADVLDYFLSNSPFLENLSLNGAAGFKNLNIVNNPHLKSLRIRKCWDLHFESLKISAPNLVSLEYLARSSSLPSSVCFENVPLLSNLTMNTAFLRSFTYDKPLHRVYSKQLEKIVMHLCPTEDYDFTVSYSKCPDFPSLRRLKQLELFITTMPTASLLYYAACVGECPFLSSLSVQFLYKDTAWKFENYINYRSERLKKKLETRVRQHHHKHLKVVRLTDFEENAEQVEFAMKLVGMCKSLEKLIIKTKRANHNDISKQNTGIMLSEETMRELQDNLPNNAKMVVEE
ncbi:OLC1v1007915C1 [Oldenlandia corymbosa var. corymbosa]|uniref:OLC1v1007915C1 n=1 Tax=Oldenlandia corymbosa var. corymbosa TaxID=529605 RepID=A0AAV1DMU2_OLDCO|nr:OLC1v1007915C1 [Oldenlandia corymbosa var. corymbosa]